MAITILPATPDDAPDMLLVGIAAFADDKLSKARFSLDTATPEQVAAYRAWHGELIRARIDGPGKFWFKAVVESTGSIVGYTGIIAPGAEMPDPMALSVPMPDIGNYEVEKEVQNLLKDTKEKWIGGRSDVWYVASMLVLPAYQGQGIAKRLFQRGLEEADKVGQDVFLEGTAAGQTLYRRCGFEDLGEAQMKLVDYKLMAMIRHPKKPAADS